MARVVFFVTIISVGVVMTSCEKENQNHLSKEKSPYLLQHKDNPVWWYAWGEEAFRAAKKENKPIFLSIGYSTCHWCHVMEHESFEDQEVADLLNRDFISIKVDREERPDVDKIYMDAVVAMQGQGGWPTSVFLTPGLKPFYGGTYFPKQQFMQLLRQVANAWEKEKEKVEGTAEGLTNHLNQQVMKVSATTVLNDSIFSASFHELSSRFDASYGGFSGAPKFPPTMSLKLLLRVYLRSGNVHAREMAERTLDQMARGGIYDHLGGGFHRYSTDMEWLTPHFEKMLYDNATLSYVYLEAFQLTKNDMYREVAGATLDYVLKAMTSPEGGFYSAEDADSEGVEGKFYVWTHEELKKHLHDLEFKKFSDVYGVTEQGNFEHRLNILHLKEKQPWSVKKDSLVRSASQKLLKIREQRIRPHRDDKVISAWNGLMIASFSKGYEVLGDSRYLNASEKAAEFISKHLIKNKELLRRYRDGEAKFSADLDDYAYLIQGLLELYDATFDVKWIRLAERLQAMQDEKLSDPEGGYFFTAKDDPNLIRRSKEYYDGALPNSNAVSILNLLRLYGLTFRERYYEKAKKTLESASLFLSKHPGAFGEMLIALDYYLDRSKEIAIIGKHKDPETEKLLSFFKHEFLPNKVVAFTSEDKAQDLPLTAKKTMKEGKTTVYVCENQTCKLPTSDFDVIKKQVSDIKRYSLD